MYRMFRLFNIKQLHRPTNKLDQSKTDKPTQLCSTQLPYWNVIICLQVCRSVILIVGRCCFFLFLCASPLDIGVNVMSWVLIG